MSVVSILCSQTTLKSESAFSLQRVLDPVTASRMAAMLGTCREAGGQPSSKVARSAELLVSSTSTFISQEYELQMCVLGMSFETSAIRPTRAR